MDRRNFLKRAAVAPVVGIGIGANATKAGSEPPKLYGYPIRVNWTESVRMMDESLSAKRQLLVFEQESHDEIMRWYVEIIRDEVIKKK